MGKYLMAIDAGTGSVRAVIFNLRGEQISEGQREWFHKEDPRYPGSMDFDWNYNWKLACDCIKEAIAKANISNKEIIAISTTCMREGIVLYDENLNEIWACANVDARSTDEVIKLSKGDPALELKLYHITGQSFALDALPRILWVKNKMPEIYEKIRYVGMFNDWLCYKLTGVLAVEPSNGSTSGLMDLKNRKFDRSILASCNLRDDILPETVECGDKIGLVTQKGAEDSGLCAGTEVIAGGGDCQLGTMGVGAVANGEAAIFGGSFWQYEYNTDKPLTDHMGRVRVNCHSVPGMWQFEALAFKPGLAMRWYRDAFCTHEKEEAKKLGEDAYDLMNKEAQKIPAGCYGMMCAFSDVMNFTCWKHASPTFTNFNFDPDKFNRYTFYRAILENTALVTKGHIDLVKESTGNEPSSVVFGGGASKSPLWCQILSDVIGKQVNVPVVKEATALGAAMLAGYGIGEYKDIKETAFKLVKIERTFTPDQKNHETYMAMYEKWREFYKTQLSLADRKVTNYMWAAPGI